MWLYEYPASRNCRRGRRRSLATVLGIVFIDLLGFGVIIPILPF